MNVYTDFCSFIILVFNSNVCYRLIQTMLVSVNAQIFTKKICKIFFKPLVLNCDSLSALLVPILSERTVTQSSHTSLRLCIPPSVLPISLPSSLLLSLSLSLRLSASSLPCVCVYVAPFYFNRCMDLNIFSNY